MRVEVLRPYFLLLLLAGAFVLTFYVFKAFFAPLVLAAIFAVVLRPLYRRLVSKFKGRTGLASLATVLIAIVCFLVPVALVTTQIVAEARDLYVSFTNAGGMQYLRVVVEQVGAFVAQFIPGTTINYDMIVADLGTYARQGLQLIISHLGGVLSSLTGLLLSAFIFFIALYYFLKDGETIKQGMMELSPLLDSDDERIFKRLEAAVNSVVRGNLMIALIQGVLATVGFFLFGVPNPVLWGTVTAISALVPGIGTALVVGPAVIYLFIAGSAGSATGLLIWGSVAVGLVDNLLGPRLMGRGTGLHPLLILLSVLGGLIVFGPIGLFLGPLSVAFLFVLLTIHAEVSRSA